MKKFNAKSKGYQKLVKSLAWQLRYPHWMRVDGRPVEMTPEQIIQKYAPGAPSYVLSDAAEYLVSDTRKMIVSWEKSVAGWKADLERYEALREKTKRPGLRVVGGTAA